MLRQFALLVLVLVLSLASGARAQTAPAPRWFIVQLTLGAAWDKSKPPNQQPGFAEHSANLRALREAGKLAMGARYADKGLLVVRAADAVEARTFFDADPMVLGNLFALQIDELARVLSGHGRRACSEPHAAVADPAGTHGPAAEAGASCHALAAIRCRRGERCRASIAPPGPRRAASQHVANEAVAPASPRFAPPAAGFVARVGTSSTPLLESAPSPITEG